MHNYLAGSHSDVVSPRGPNRPGAFCTKKQLQRLLTAFSTTNIDSGRDDKYEASPKSLVSGGQPDRYTCVFLAKDDTTVTPWAQHFVELE
ncbi:hypothetical protein T265_02793 [Opisthorchis viverrini]|uniref:Uncharacterized protein n=1 Tax=Opisthorchis viverrini TaxID=6198 RepID=A0A074ZY04_OPIVI|nr:hypothetical protein T265_02793 [Opisthorchis viverrini]KER30862.1 hypothetical protein T265_02793 [Opisthorchis viverrini]